MAENVKAVAWRIGMAIAIAMAVVLPLNFALGNDWFRGYRRTAEPAPAAIQQAVAEFSSRLGVPTPQVAVTRDSPFGGLAWCRPTIGCTVEIDARTFRHTPAYQRALVGHELGHVWQWHSRFAAVGTWPGGETLTVVVVMALVVLVAASTGLGWWALSSASLLCLGWGMLLVGHAVLLNQIAEPMLTFATIAAVVVAACDVGIMRLAVTRADRDWPRVGRTTVRVAGGAVLSYVLWANLQHLENVEKPLELEADRIALQLTSPAEMRAFVDWPVRPSNTDIYHPSFSERLNALHLPSAAP